MISKFHQFISEEVSKNNPIPEIDSINKLCIIMMGPPGIGKSTFIEKEIYKRRYFKSFSTDDVSALKSKIEHRKKLKEDPTAKIDLSYQLGSSELNLKMISEYMNTGQPLIYDTTGDNIQVVRGIYDEALGHGYEVIFIYLFGSKELAWQQNLKRSRQVDWEYLSSVFRNKARRIKQYTRVNPKSYYLVENKGYLGYDFYRLSGYNLTKRNKLGEYEGNYNIDDILIKYDLNSLILPYPNL